MIRAGASSARIAVCAVLAAGALWARPAAAEITITRTPEWELYTTGRVGGFFSYGQGDSNPPPLPGTADIPPGGGLDVGTDNIPRIDPATGMPIPGAQGTFRSMRLRSGFLPNILGIGFRQRINEDTTLKIFVSLWATIESDGQRKTNPITTDAREGYLRVDGRWGTLVVGRALDLVSRGAVEIDFLYGHGFGVGYPGNINSLGPTTGLINFGVLAAFYSPGISYATPVAGGLQLTVGVYDPTPLQGTFEGTRWARPEAELTYDAVSASGWFKLHLFANGEYQKIYGNGNDLSVTSAGVGYGGRAELGLLHLGVMGHYGPGLGLGYALEPGSISVSQNFHLRTFDGYAAFVQLAFGKVDLNLNAGVSRAFELQEDVDMNVSVLKRQIGVSGAIVVHLTPSLHYDIDALHGDARWYLGEKQQFTFVSTGMTATW
jgi:hypothetical protein